MPPTETYRLCQMIHFLRTLMRDEMDITTRTLLENRCVRGPESQGGITELYTMFNNQGNKPSYQTA